MYFAAKKTCETTCENKLSFSTLSASERGFTKMPAAKKTGIKALRVVRENVKAHPKTMQAKVSAKKPLVKLNPAPHYEQFACAANGIAGKMEELGISQQEILEACENARAELARERYPELFQ